jgi:osmotically-inducible protein OsmY
MKFFIFLLGIAAGAAGYHYYHKPTCAALTPGTAASVDNRTVAEKARDGAQAAKESLSEKMVEWNLTPAEINQDLEKTGRVVRTKTAVASQGLSNARVVAVIKGKYALEDQLSARLINVDADAGKVTLRGTAPSAELIARAIAIALETEGVTSVDSQLTVSPK